MRNLLQSLEKLYLCLCNQIECLILHSVTFSQPISSCNIYFFSLETASSVLTCHLFKHAQVMLLGRLHHRNLVNLIGYCEEKGQHILIYVYMSKGSLASHLYSKLSTNNMYKIS